MSWIAPLIVGLILAPLADEPAILRGRITGEGGEPLAGVRVRVVVPAADMRFVDIVGGRNLAEARSDAEGRYRVEILGLTGPAKASIDAMTPGYRRLSGTLMARGDARDVEVGPGRVAEADLRLEPARYVGGVVIDGRGRPIHRVKISSTLSDGDNAIGIEETASQHDGSFGIFGFPLIADARAKYGDNVRGSIRFVHPDYIEARFEDVDTLGPDQLKDLRITLDSGYRLSGTVVDDAGRPVAGAKVGVASQDGTQAKQTLTDVNGKFAVRGLKEELVTLNVRANDIKQKAAMFLAIRADQEDMEVRLSKIVLPPDLVTYKVLGLRLADVTPDLQSAYDLRQARGALILDPGPNPGRLGIGKLDEGSTFLKVGNASLGTVREFVDRILAEAVVAPKIRVVYAFKRADTEGTNTQFLNLTQDDIENLQAVADRLRMP